MLKKLLISGVIVFVAGGIFFLYADHEQKSYMKQLQQLDPQNTYWEDVDKTIDQQYSVNPLLKAFLRANMNVELQKEYESQAGQNHNIELYLSISTLMMIFGFCMMSFVGINYAAKGLVSGGERLWLRIFSEKPKTNFVEVKPKTENLLEPEVIEKESILDESLHEDVAAGVSAKDQWKSKKQYYSTMKTIYNPEKQTSAAIANSIKAKTTDLEDMIKQQFTSLEKQITDVRQMTTTSSQNEAGINPVYDKTLAQLTRQVAAMNEFTSKQQEKVKNLQEGYDWNIIKNFALRIVRCIDNLDATIERMSDSDEDVSALEQTRDDFLFALESSGIEQFKPEINSDYRGQEKFAEAVSKRQVTPEQMLKGKVAKVVRPGYKFIIDDQRSKMVRTAQVKLYG